MDNLIKLSAGAACRILGMEPDHLNVHISAGRFPCAPRTTPGKARVFDFDDMFALWLFRDRLGNEPNARTAGHFACLIAEKSRQHPDADLISIVRTSSGHTSVHIATDLPSMPDWNNIDFPMSGMTILDVKTYNVKHIRALLAQLIEDAV